MRSAAFGIVFFVIVLSAIAAGIFFLSPGLHAGRPAEIRIADSKGDWGHPTPYHHYPRGPGYVRMSWVFDTLIWKDQNGHVPALATSWSYQADREAFLFELHPEARWHDGEPVTAEDVAFTIEYFKKHPYNWITLDNISHTEILAPHTLAIHLETPYAPFLSDVGGTMPILPRHIWDSVDNPRNYTEADAFIGSGPFKFRNFNKAQGTYLYEAFDEYYQGRPAADRLIYIRSEHPLISLTSGQADLVSIQPDMVPALEREGLTIIRDERGWNKKLMINHKKAPFDDRRFRHALAYAIDRQEIIDKAHRGYGAPASYGLLSVDHDMYNPGTPSYDVDPEKTAAILEDMGYSRGGGGFYRKDGEPLTVELILSNITVGGQRRVDRDGEVIKKQLEDAGIQVELISMEQTTTDNKIRNWDFDLAISGHGGISGDPRILNEMISPEYGAGSVNSARYDACGELNELLEKQILEMDEDRRKQIVFRIQEVYARELPAISLYYPENFAASNPKAGVQWYFTPGGISKGIPIAQNKMSLIRPADRPHDF